MMFAIDGTSYLYLAGAITASVVSLIGGYVAWRKLRPETTSIQVTTAENLVEIAIKTSQFVEQHRDNLVLQVQQLQGRLDGFQVRVEQAEHRATLAEERAHVAEAEVVRLTGENSTLRQRVQALEVEVRELKGNSE